MFIYARGAKRGRAQHLQFLQTTRSNDVKRAQTEYASKMDRVPQNVIIVNGPSYIQRNISIWLAAVFTARVYLNT